MEERERERERDGWGVVREEIEGSGPKKYHSNTHHHPRNPRPPHSKPNPLPTGQGVSPVEEHILNLEGSGQLEKVEALRKFEEM